MGAVSWSSPHATRASEASTHTSGSAREQARRRRSSEGSIVSHLSYGAQRRAASHTCCIACARARNDVHAQLRTKPRAWRSRSRAPGQRSLRTSASENGKPAPLMAAVVKDGANGLGERVGRDGLLQEVDACVEHAVMNDRGLRIAGDVQYPHARSERLHALDELATRHAGHHDVGDEQVDRTWILLADQERLAAVLRFEHVVADTPQDRASHDPDLS